ncbi:MAG: hypothetical protein WA118_08185 [Carboxydocellales bacterium]
MGENREVVYVTVKPNRRQVIVETPYNADFIGMLKVKVYWQKRSWDNEAKAWTVSDEYRQTVINMVKEYFPNTPAYLLEGAVTKNLHTGEVVQQQTLFREG